MRKLIKSIRDHQLPKTVTRAQWVAATVDAFAPFFRRKRELRQNIDSFQVELRNLARIVRYPEYVGLLSWCLRLQRRVLKRDRSGAYENMLTLFANLQASDDRWLNMFATAAPLEVGAAIQDRAYHLFTTIEGVAEGCYKPQLQILIAFAKRDSGMDWPVEVLRMDLGRLVSEYPSVLRDRAPLLLSDPELEIPVNQWRNIAAHRTFRLVSAQTIEVRYGKGNERSQRISIHQLRRAWYWLLRTHTAARLANTIIYIEHMKELHALGVPRVDMRLSAMVMHITHGLATVGFESVRWEQSGRQGVLVLIDRLNREPQHALIHASQVLDQLSLGVLYDPAMRTRIDKVGVALVSADGTRFGTALISVQIADRFSRREINMKDYVSHVEWTFEGVRSHG